jgi:hypothetical protein
MKAMRRCWFLGLVLLMLTGLLACGVDSGGDDDNWCPGVICSNCAGDCDNAELHCASDQTEACVGGSYFDADENLRCAFCLDN